MHKNLAQSDPRVNTRIIALHKVLHLGRSNIGLRVDQLRMQRIH